MAASHSNGSWIEPGREAGLLLSAQNGDTDAFAELVREHSRPLYRVAFVLVRHPSDAGQLVIETARLAWRGIRQLPVGRPFLPYLVRIARNLAIAHQRRRAGERVIVPASRPSGIPWGGATGNPALAAEEQRLFELFASLTLDEQLLFALRRIEGLTYAQIAAVLDVPVGSVMHRLQALRGRIESATREEAA